MLSNKVNTLKPFGKQKVEKAVTFTLCAYTDDIAHALAEKFYRVDQVSVVQGNIVHLDCTALVSPANSFGEMSGGLDKVIDDFYSGKAQTEAIKIIREQYFGELPVGMGLIIKMNSKKFPYLILAPTMRIPGREVNGINAYLAMRGLLVAIATHNRNSNSKLDSIAIPSLCTGVGGMSAEDSAEQMYTAYDNVVMSGWEYVKHPAIAPYALKKNV